jgi:hypothetical protein
MNGSPKVTAVKRKGWGASGVPRFEATGQGLTPCGFWVNNADRQEGPMKRKPKGKGGKGC